MADAAQRGFLVLVLSMMASSVSGADFSGRYVSESEASVVLTLEERPDGVVSGTLSDAGLAMPLNARRNGAGFAGTLGPPSLALPFNGFVEADRVILDVGVPGASQRYAFKRAAIAPTADRPAAGTQGRRNVIMNGTRLTDEELKATEQTYRLRIPDADYWYDRVLGAWGVRGGPTMGFIRPGLDLGGPLAADASGRGVGVFVNGRALHPIDVMALQAITGPIMPGRYFITAQGLAGYEGGPPLWNLAVMVAQAQGGGSNTWQSRISSGFSDGTTGAVFLPNGGIVSTGQ
jgi:hypothetical protein